MDEQSKHHHNEECDCGEHGEACGCSCGNGCCEGGDQFERRYRTKEEQIADLTAYLGELKLEVQAVEEHLADLRK